MIVQVGIQIDSDRVRIHCPQADIDEDFPNIVAYNASKPEITAIGVPQERLQRESPDWWYEMQDDIEFRNPFDIQRFHTGLAFSVLRYLTFLVPAAIAKDGNHKLKGRCRFEYDVDIDGYQRIHEDARAQFEASLLYQLSHCRVSVRGQLLKRWQYKAAAWMMRLVSILGFASFFIVAAWVAPGIITRSLLKLRSVVLTLITCTAGYVGLVYGVMVCILIERRIFPSAVVKTALPSGGMPKFVVRWFTDVLLQSPEVDPSAE